MILSSKFGVTKHNDVTVIKMQRSLFGQDLLHAYAFMYKDTLIDTGTDYSSTLLKQLAQQQQIQKIFLTHHHEDHSGSAHSFNIPVFSSAKTAQIMRKGFKLKFYQKLLWGKMRVCECQTFSNENTIGNSMVKIIETPGHSDDHVAFFLPQKKWLFSGDLFIHQKIKYFRRDEDFSKTIDSLQSVLSLDFTTLFCCHYGIVEQGKKALQNKLDHLLRIEDKVRTLHAEGLSIKQISRKLTKSTSVVITFGDVSTNNLVYSILHGARPRKDIHHILETTSK
ncbi:MBL fold metallo-hydrolase [Candidatus Uabimicrobium sp. HlEnr_7]|uniref:MBL fold metallo-hydrolase n=1 Tax=Candidatus Uabimicrobium helgolandensis TaxID=3095367 RepID=UPI0035566E59